MFVLSHIIDWVNKCMKGQKWTGIKLKVEILNIPFTRIFRDDYNGDNLHEWINESIREGIFAQAKVTATLLLAREDQLKAAQAQAKAQDQ